MISLRGVNRVFGHGPSSVIAVQDVALEIARGEIFGVIGYSGAGKSTLVRLLNGLEQPSSGEITVNGARIDGVGERALRRLRPKIGMIFQHFNLLWSRNVRGNIALPMQIAGHPRAHIRSRTDELIRLVGLEGREDAWPSQLSGGQKQRVGIARALANEPDVLLCDEATSALDPETTGQIIDLLAEINRRLDLTIVLITHEMHVVRAICHRVAVMEAGRIVEEGPVSEVFARPRQPVTQRFLRQLGEAEGRLVTVEAREVAELADLVRTAGQPVTLLAARPGADGATEFTLRLGASHKDAEPLAAPSPQPQTI